MSRAHGQCNVFLSRLSADPKSEIDILGRTDFLAAT